jgi:hypothetical protein
MRRKKTSFVPRIVFRAASETSGGDGGGVTDAPAFFVADNAFSRHDVGVDSVADRAFSGEGSFVADHAFSDVKEELPSVALDAFGVADVGFHD